jgi:hypothetical protein
MVAFTCAENTVLPTIIFLQKSGTKFVIDQILPGLEGKRRGSIRKLKAKLRRTEASAIY